MFQTVKLTQSYRPENMTDHATLRNFEIDEDGYLSFVVDRTYTADDCSVYLLPHKELTYHAVSGVMSGNNMYIKKLLNMCVFVQRASK